MTTQRKIAEELGLPIHPPKTEIFDLAGGTNTDPKGHVRQVDQYHLTSFGLYLARSIPGHAKLTYVESWLLPALGLRVSKWQFAPGHELDQDFYLDVTGIVTGAEQWSTTDYYLDISVSSGKHAIMLDIDEFVIATQANLLDAETSRRAMEVAYSAVDGIARHGYELDEWLLTKDIELSWWSKPA